MTALRPLVAQLDRSQHDVAAALSFAAGVESDCESLRVDLRAALEAEKRVRDAFNWLSLRREWLLYPTIEHGIPMFALAWQGSRVLGTDPLTTIEAAMQLPSLASICAPTGAGVR